VGGHVAAGAELGAELELVLVEEAPGVVGATARGAGVMPWSSKALRSANAALDNGATAVTVASQAEAAELLLGRYLGDGYRNVTGMGPLESRNFFGEKSGSYHWDIGDRAYPHGMNHLQVHTINGEIIMIYFP